MKVAVRILLVLLVLFLGLAAAIGIPIIREIDALNDQMEEMTEQARAGKLSDQELSARFIDAASAQGLRAEDADIKVTHPEPGTVEMKAAFKVQLIQNSGWVMALSFHSKRP